MLALPLKHREKAGENSSIVDEDRNILYSFLKDKLSVSNDLAEVHQFTFPKLKVGTLDSLVTAGEDLAKMDPALEAAVNRLVTNLKGLFNGDCEQLRSSLLVNEVATPEAYVKCFQWNVMKYRTDRNVTEIAETLVAEAQQIDNLLKARLSTFNQAKTAVNAIERKSGESLLSKDLGPYVKPEDFIEKSDFMKTLLVVVPKTLKFQWESSYEHLSGMVVPRTSRMLAEEGDYLLYNVTIFEKVKDEFVKKAGEQKFTVREYVYDEGRRREVAEAEEAMLSDMKAQWSSLVRLLKTNFGELFSAWIHLKVLRLFVESVLQYGLPPQFLSLIIKPNGNNSKDPLKGEKKLRLALLQHLEQLQLPGISQVDIAAAIHSSTSVESESVEEAELWTALNMTNRDQDPFVKIPLKWTVPL